MLGAERRIGFRSMHYHDLAELSVQIDERVEYIRKHRAVTLDIARSRPAAADFIGSFVHSSKDQMRHVDKATGRSAASLGVEKVERDKFSIRCRLERRTA